MAEQTERLCAQLEDVLEVLDLALTQCSDEPEKVISTVSYAIRGLIAEHSTEQAGNK